MSQKLFAAYLGGRFQDNFIEDHEIIFVVARNKDEAKILAKVKSKITIDIHCDGIIEIENVDGYSIKVESE
jgi:hypothetical protein